MKRNKKKKKKEETVVKSIDDVDNVPAPDDRSHLSDKINIWTKAKDDGKSYAEVLAEGLDERRESLQNEQYIDRLDTKDLSDIVIDKPESFEKDIEFITIASPSEIENDEVCGSWAKVVASNRPSPERTQKDIIHSHENKVMTKAPVILVDESDSEHHKPEVEIDAEGFITVDRSRRSRSRSRDDRLTNVSKTYKKNDAREKSENRFNALTCTLKPDDSEPVQCSHTEDEKELIKKGRKSRSSKSREKDVKVKLVQTATSTTDDDKQPVKKDKRKRSSKSKEKINKEVETFESAETLKQIVETEPIDIKKEVQQNIQPLQEEAVESKKKAKKKKKEKKLINEINDAPSLIEITSSEQESTEQKHYTVKSKCIETPISTPESLQTPIKDRFYSEVQYWKVDPNTLDDSSTLSEILTIEMEHDTKTEHEHLVAEEQLLGNNEVYKINPSDTEILDKGLTGLQTEVSSLTADILKQNITEELSLENKMADLQREIEELLLPENDASVTSEETPKELADTQISLDEQHDEIFENITPSFASPEPEEIYPKTQVIEFDSTLADHEISTKIMPVSDHTILSDIRVTVAADKEKPADKHVEGVNSLTTNISPTTTTNNIIDLKLDDFWVCKSIADDAEKTLVRQTVLSLNSYVPSEEMVQLESDTNSEQLFSDDYKILNNLITDTFWPEKHLYHDAECEYFSQIAQKTKFKFISNADIEVTDKRDKDKDPGGGSGHSSDVDEPRESSGSPFDSNYISMDLPGGICSWKDHSSYLSLETPTDSLTGIVSEGMPILGTDIPEDKLTNLSLEPDASFPPVQELAPGEDENRTSAKDDLSNSLEILLEEVKIVQAQLSDLPNETLDAMEAGLKEGIEVLVKCEEAAILLEQKIMEFNQEVEVQALLKELIVMKAKISKLLIQARQGLQTIKDARIEIENQSKQIEEQKEQIGKLDSWLDAINTELKESAKGTDVLTEEDIIRYIEIYERYIKEYENYETILRTITVISHDESSQSMQIKINALKKALEESKHLVISEIERLRQILLNMKFTPEVVEEGLSQTDRTIDSTSMPEEIASSEEIEPIGLVPPQKSLGTSIVPDSPTSQETEDRIFVDTKVEVQMTPNIEEVKNTVVKESQTGKSLISDAPSMHDKSIICQPQIIETHDVSVTCAPPQDVEVQTGEPKSHAEEFLENIQVTQTISDGHETIVISSKPVVRDQQGDDHSLLVDADYKDDNLHKNSQLNITHSLPQAFETVMVEPDETTTEVVVDADGTKRIIVKKIRKTLVTRQQTVQMQPHDSQIMSGEEGALQERSFQQITIKENKGSSSTFGDGRIQNVQYQTYGGQVITGLPGREMSIQEITSKPEMVISMEKGMSPDQILQVAEGEVQSQVQTSSSSVTAVVEQVTKRIIKTRRRIIRRVVIIDGKEHVSEEIVEEPDTVEVLEEQIPKVSINVKESNIPFEIDDSFDSNNQPPPLSRDSNGKEKPLKDKTQGGKCTDKSVDLPEEVTTTKSQDLQSLTEQNYPEYSDTNQEYNQSRLEVLERETVPSSTSLTPENICLEPQQRAFEQIDFQNKKSALLTGEQLTQSEALSSHFASVTQTVTRKITRTRKRIIKHIEIIDGKENITEEIIEEPDDVEIIEEEPKITRQCLDQGIKMKKMKVIRQVQMIDGKERVTEQIIEESDDADNFEPHITTKSYIEVCDKDKPSELEQREIMMMKNEPEDFIDMTKRLISSETDHTIATKTSPVKSIYQSVKPTKDVKDKKDENLPEINMPAHKIENISKVKETEQNFVTVHLGNKTEVPQSLYLTSAETEKRGRDNDPTTDTTQNSSNTNEKEEELNLDYKSFTKIEKIPSLPSTLHQHEIEQGNPTQESSTNLSRDIEKTKPETISAAAYLKGNNADIMTNKPPTKIIKTRTRVIKHIQIIDGKEHVKEEIVEEPEEVELFITDPKTYVIQEEGVKTKRLRIIKNIEIIDGKEHVTEKILEDPDYEYMPHSTITADIDLQVSQSTEPHLESNINNTKEQDPQRRIVEDTLTIEQQKGISTIDVSKSFIDREIDHAEIIQKPSFYNNEQIDRKKILVAELQTDSNKEIISQSEVNPEITKVEYLHIPTSSIEETTSSEISNKEEQQTPEIRYTSPITTSPMYSSQKTVIMGEDNTPKDYKSLVLVEPKESTSSFAEEATPRHEKLSIQNKNASKNESQKATLIDITKTLLSSEIDHTAMVNTFKREREESKINPEKVFISEETALDKTLDKPTFLETSQNKTQTTSDLTEAVIPSYHIIQAKHGPGSEEEIVTNKIIPKDHKPSSDVESSQIKSKHDTTLEENTLDHVIMKEDNTSVKQPFKHFTKVPKEMELTQMNTPENVTYSDLGQFKSEVALKEAPEEVLQTPNAKGRKQIDLTSIESKPNIVNESIRDLDNIDVTHDQDVKSSLIKIVKQADSIDGQEVITEHIKRIEDMDCLPESTITTQIYVSTSKPDALTENKLMKVTNERVNAKADKSVLDITKELISKETGHMSQLSTLQKQCLHQTEELEVTKEDMKDDDKIYSDKIDTKARPSPTISANLSDINSPLSKSSKTIKPVITPDSIRIDQPNQDDLPVIEDLVIDHKLNSSTKTESEKPLEQNEPFNKEQLTGHIILDKTTPQSSVSVQPLYAESIVTESHTAAQPTMRDLSYIKQNDPQSLLYDDENLLKQILVPNETTSKSDQTPTSDTKHKVIAFMEQERNSDSSNFKVFEKSQETQTAHSKAMLPKTVDINMSIEKTDARSKIVPNIQLNLKVEDYESQDPCVAKKDVDISLPAEIKITNEPRHEGEICAKPEEKEKVRNKSKKNKKQKCSSECSDSFETDVQTNTDRTINDTESSSLGHYVELPVSPLTESPKPSENLLQQTTVAEVQSVTSSLESESTAENKGYEPEDTTTCSSTASGKRKRHKKRKVSDDTIYPKQSSTEDDTLASTSIETDEDKRKIKDTDKKEQEDVIESNAISSDVKLTINPVLGEIVTSETISTSPKEESCHTISESSDFSTVKIVEECVGSSPEMAQTEIPTMVTYPIRVVEEVLTQEYSMQTSPEIINDSAIPEIESKIKSFTVKTTDSGLQTSPTFVDDSFVQTMPKEDKEAHTQTVADNVIPDKVEVQDSQNQTSGLNSPDNILQSEAVTQVVPRDINYFEEKFSQTSSPITEFRKEAEPLVELECREIQTSPTPQIRQDEKSTEITIDTADSNIQTITQENIDKETSTSPLKVKVATEISVQTPHVSYVNVFTQSEDHISRIDAKQKLNEEISHTPYASEHDSEKDEKVLIDNSQQTTPRSVESIGLQIDNTEQTSPRFPTKKITALSQPQNTEIESISTDKIQQTSPRSCSENTTLGIKRELKTVDSMLQTSPLTYSDDSISTSTDDPYEIHLRAQISIPQVTDDFINIERQIQEPAQSIIGDKSKQKKRRSKKKAESPLQSPGSLSDPINAELSLSVTPTSEDISSRQTDSADEGISHISSQTLPNMHQLATQPKLTYSDVVQRSKSKSPSPSKSVLPSRKSEKARLIDSVEKRTQSIAEPQKNIEQTMAVSLIEPSMEKSYGLVVDKELSKLRQSVELNDTNKLEKSVIIVIETISIWLEEIQHKIQIETVTGTKVTDKSERLKDLQNYIRNLKQIIYVTEVNEEIITLIETLTRQVDAVKNLSNESSVKLKEIEKGWNKFLEDTEILSISIEKVKSRLDKIIVLELSVQQKLDELDKIETENIDNTDIVRKMFRRFRSIVEANPKRECPTKLYTCDENTKQIENSVNTERDRLMQLMSLAEEYEQTLQDFGQITDVAEALLDGKIIVSDLDHLHEEIQKHRKFFVNLSHCRAILESLEDNLDSETRAKFSSLHNSLHDRATKIIDRAAGRAQQMTLAASRWSILDNGMKEEQQWLRVAHQRIPDLTNVTSMDHEQYINLYQSISLDVSHHYAKILRLLSIAENLQHLITCSKLESVCSTALDTLLTLQENIDSRLTRLRAFKENWVTYEHLIDRVENWMKLANRELENITPENITTTPNLRRFWELKAQHEVHHNLKNESGIQFEKALEILPISDEMVQRQFFLKIEDKWRNLSARIDDLHTTAIQNISDRDVSSGEKLHILEEELRELRASLDGLKGVIKSEDELNLYIERLQVMTGRIDRIQNELGRLSLLPTAESDRLGALLSQSGILNDQIAEELERSLILKEKIMQVQAGIVRCQKNQRRARLTLEECESAERLGSDVVERASETCQRLLEDLASQWQDILTLRQALHTLPISLRVCVSPTGVERDISALQETHAEIEAACSDLCARLRAKLQLWRRYERQLELVQGAVREADYMVELLTVQGQVDYDRLLKATEKLETLSESLSRRSGELVGELRDAAVPLEATTEPGVAAQLRRELDDAAAAYEHTCTNLSQMCDKYQRAVELWRRYREAASAVRGFAEAQEAHLHALRPADAPAHAHACLEQEARVAELRSLAAQVAAETGSRALQADADALARRLQLVAGAVQALADLGEARQLARAKAQNAKDKLCDMRQDLAPVEEDGEKVEHKLITLRDNLIALGKSEADIAPAKAQLPDIDRDVSEEHSIVRILELWQAMFRDTFLHYHRLSTALIRSGDAATALKLWHEYLLDLQSFLSGSLPADYENLTEHRRLCRVHRNLLASQRSVLMSENKETNNRDLADKFDILTNLHNETLARIVERHDEVCTRIAAWDDYREIYTELLRWLKEMEREKEKLQLRYVHIKRIQKILSKIQNLYDKLPEGRKFADKLSVYLKRVLAFTEETYGASVRMEYAGIVKRVDNLQASLDTWRDFLTRILGLIGEYENLTGNLHKLYSRTQDEVMSYSDEDRLSRPQIKKAIERYSELRKKIDKTENQIEALSVIQEQLKECLSPQDIRIVNQKVWQMRQQRADLEHQLSILIHRLQERLEIYTIFDSRLSRFSEWMTTLESRLESSSSSSEVSALDPQDLIRRINSDIQAETAIKEREYEWLAQTGSSLIDISKKDEKSYSKNISKQLKDVQERWQKLQETGRSRIAKINELLETISQLEERLTEIRLKLHSIESKLSASVVIEYLSTKVVDEKFQDRDEIHKNIEDESSEVGETLNLCELVFNDPDVLKGNFDLRNLRTGVDIVDKKWKNICEMSEQRKNALKEIRKSAELANSLLPKVEKKLDSIEKRVEKVEIRKQRGESEDDSVSKAVIKDLDALEEDVKRLEDAYSRIASARGIEMRGEGADHTSRLRVAVRRWQQLRVRVNAVGTDLQRQFVAAHGKAVVALAEADVRLTRALHLAPTPLDQEATLKELDGVEQEVRECEALVKEADRLEAALGGEGGTDALASEYRTLLADVTTRLQLARQSIIADVDSAVQVDTLKWEMDAALQVDTLTSKETYRVELAAAVKETSESLEALRTALMHELKENASGDELATAAKEIAKAGAKPGQTLELAKHLSELLLTECDATEEEAMLKEVESLSMRYEELLTQAKKRELQINNLRLPHSASYALTCEHESGRLTCPLCSDRNWKQLDNDLWRLEQWLQFAEAADEARTGPPEQYDALEDAIQDHREFLLDLDSHKALVVSLNVVGAHVARHARSAAAGERASARLAAANARWDAACARAADWQKKLQHALMHNQQFHDIVVELVGQLAAAERTVRAREPLRLRRAADELRRDFRRFSELRDELARAEPRVQALRDAAALLQARDSQDVCRRWASTCVALAVELRRDFRRFSELRDELARAEPRVQALRDAAALLQARDSQDVCRRWASTCVALAVELRRDFRRFSELRDELAHAEPRVQAMRDAAALLQARDSQDVCRRWASTCVALAVELRRDFRRFSELRDELARAEPRVQALRDAAALLQARDSQDVCRRLGELRLRLQSLRKLAGVYALKLGAALAHHPSAGVAAVAAAAAAPQLLEEEEEQMSSLNLPPLDESDVALSEEHEEQSLGRVQRGLRFVCRVARASLPFQALLLLLLGAAALVPHAHSDCRPPGLGLEPVLRYPDGPPPL
ncbi:unnamed protein product [Parnassius apollo]|uniref:(apollo) hypothetical protein n=1 Tax=Parnassius apollo TaxID=110799 RepID=A0A8S3X3S2_PARAO|nr:unnamed protein product [Parnassius apollo]